MSVPLLTALALLIPAVPAVAQRFPFERSVTVAGDAKLDVITNSGKVDVSVGEADRVEIRGTVTVRLGWNVPADAVAIAQRVAANPPIENAAGILRLRDPSDATERRAVVVSYQVRVPRTMPVRVSSDSGAIAIRDVAGTVDVTTQSSAVSLTQLGDSADVRTGSGAVDVDGIGGALRITTSSSAIGVSGARGSLHARTQSGEVRAAFAGAGDADVQTSSSAITLEGLSGEANVRSQSGRVTVSGRPLRSWTVSTGSSAISAEVGAQPVTLDLTSGSGSVRVDGLSVNGITAKERVSGTVGAGGPTIRLSSRSGSIRLSGAR